jgi:hypothetical protein
MADIKDEEVTETFSIIVQPQVNGQYFCQLSSASDTIYEKSECFGDLIMFPLREIEGTWEELIQNADEFSGKRFKLTLLDNNESRELELLKEINVGISAKIWEEFHALEAKRRAGILTEEEHKKLIEINDSIEAASFHRLTLLVELASIRGRSLPEIMSELGISGSQLHG